VTPKNQRLRGQARCTLIKHSNHMAVILRVPKAILIGGSLAVFSLALFAQTSVAPLGGEFSILGSVPGDQVLPSLSLSSSGGCVVWQDNGIDKKGAGVGGSLLDNNFISGRMFQVNRLATGDQIKPQVQLLANDNTIYVWESSVAGTPDIYARLSKDTAKGSHAYGSNFYTVDLRANAVIADAQADPAVAALPDGSAIITWASYGQDGSMFGVFARRLLASGKWAKAKEFQVNQYTSYNQRNPAIATLASGNYVIAWVSEQERYANSLDVYARIFTPAGVPVTEEIAINSGSHPCATPTVAALNDGGFTVVWGQKDTVATNGWDIWGRPFSATGMPEASDFRINTFLYGDQFQPKIAAGPAGSLVVWTSMGEDGSREGVYGRFLPGGTQVFADEFRVNTTTVSQQFHPAVAWNGVDRFLVVWSSFVGAAGFDLYGQAYVLTSNSSP